MADIKKLIDLEGLVAFYTKLFTEDLAEYAKYEDISSPSAIVAPTIVGGLKSITITNNDSRPLTIFYSQEESIDKDDPSSIENIARIPAGVTQVYSTYSYGVYYVKAYADDGVESSIYTVTVKGGSHSGGSDD